MFRPIHLLFLVCTVVFAQQAPAPAPAKPARAQPPTRDPNTAGYVKAKELPDGTVPTAKQNGNFIIGPTHPAAPETVVNESVPQGQIIEFTMESIDSKIYSGIAREPGTFGQPDPADPSRLLVKSSPKPYSRKVSVYVPKQYVPGTVAPLLVGADGPDRMLFTTLDNLIAAKRVPVMISCGKCSWTNFDNNWISG